MKQVISKLQELADNGAINRNAKRVPQNVSSRRSGGGRNTPANQLKAVKSAVKKYLPLWKERFDEKDLALSKTKAGTKQLVYSLLDLACDSLVRNGDIDEAWFEYATKSTPRAPANTYYMAVEEGDEVYDQALQAYAYAEGLVSKELVELKKAATAQRKAREKVFATEAKRLQRMFNEVVDHVANMSSNEFTESGELAELMAKHNVVSKMAAEDFAKSIVANFFRKVKQPQRIGV